MTVMVTDNFKRFHGSGGTGPFTWTWRFLANADIQVYLIAEPDEDHPSLEEKTLLVEGDDYSLTGAGGYVGGTLTLISALEVGADLLVERNTEPVQRVSIRNQGNNFIPSVHENVFDRLAMMNQDQLRRIVGFEEIAADLRGRATDLEDRVTATEGDIATLFARVTTVIVTPPAGESGDVVVHQSAFAGDTYIDVVAANDPTARTMVIGKTDTSANLVIFRPTAGNVMGLTEYPIDGQNVYRRFIPRASDNTWIVSN
ncbi:hypothetical protein [Geobacter sp. SVR]|uniref:hypothetical protein n=1 Tax=Geobacter sp. SVR TaxID=2495594 RepID=UPI00143F0272|nr:hypothetical protein [Geobacter sp. SVR]BCS54788.1 hypothetical protein GSVR_30960 [Geobacter sp. SVR]GCF86404.1 hypothetical protein GSbR_30040 [Geobacter sp. SVR]